MMVLLSKHEYDSLVQKATAMELQVEQRVEQEKEKIWEALRRAFEDKEGCHLYTQNPYLAARKKLEEISR